MRLSDWQITWNPATTAKVILDYGDLMDTEIRLGGQQLGAVGNSDFALSGTPISRKNAKRRLDFTRRLPQATPVLSWAAAIGAVRTAPWGITVELTIQPRGGVAKSFSAALLSLVARPDHLDGLVESVENWSFRIAPN